MAKQQMMKRIDDLEAALKKIAYLRPMGSTPKLVDGSLLEQIERIALSAIGAPTMVQNADGDDFIVLYDAELKEWRGEQFTGLSKNFLNMPALLHAKSQRELLHDIANHRCAS